MIKLHHLNKSRSKRIIWLLEELGCDYQLIPYQRDAQTSLAPAALLEVHPLGKSPVIEDGDHIIAESGAITQYLIDTYGAARLAPAAGSDDYLRYLEWLHFAEGSAMLPLLLKMFIKRDGCKTNFIDGYAQHEIEKIGLYINSKLTKRRYLVGDTLTGADIMMSFVVEILARGDLTKLPNIAQYLTQLNTHAGYRRAGELEAEHAG